MTKAAQSILAAYEALSPAEQHEVAAAVLRRSAGTDELSEAAMHELANERFLAYETEEAAPNAPS